MLRPRAAAGDTDFVSVCDPNRYWTAFSGAPILEPIQSIVSTAAAEDDGG